MKLPYSTNFMLSDEFDEGELAAQQGRRAPKRWRPRQSNPSHSLDPATRVQPSQPPATESLIEQFDPTFTGSKHEHRWILDYLGIFYTNQMITDVLRPVQGGKEANVYCCAAHPATGLELVAAKLYRPRMFRQLRNDARYRAGRDQLTDCGHVIIDRRSLRAIQLKTDYGQRAAHISWLSHEFQTMELLHAAGIQVPRPLEQTDNAILMEYLGAELTPAPTLHQVRLDRSQVRPLFEKLMGYVDRMLSCGRVHADLSAFNVLYWEGDVWLIDFPQAVDPILNPDAYEIFERDITRLCQYFDRYQLPTDPAALAQSMWEKHKLPMVEPHLPIVDDDWGPGCNLV